MPQTTLFFPSSVAQSHFDCAWFYSLARLPTETARVFFLSHFLRKKRLYLSSFCFSYLFNASTRLICTLSFAQSRKIPKFSKLSPILKRQGKNFVVTTSIVRLSSNRSQARSNQNVRIINNYSPKWKRIVVDIYRTVKRRGKYPSRSPTLS